MDTIAKFKEAAGALQRDERYLKLAAARKANDHDEALQAAIGEFNLVRLDLNNEIEKDDRNDDRIQELNARVTELYNSIMQNPNMLAYDEAKQNIRPLVEHINAIVAAAVDGDDPMLVEEPSAECGGSCASCGGCG